MSGYIPNSLQVYNFIAQRDSQISEIIGADSREIAAASKLDSTAMKGMAVVTMLFLPGTFFAVSHLFIASEPTSERSLYSTVRGFDAFLLVASPDRRGS